MNIKTKAYRFLLTLLCSFVCGSAMAFIRANSAVNYEMPLPADTTITYSMDGTGGEGAEAVARYVKGRIKECNIKVFGENGQSRIRYIFLKDRISVTEQQYTYKGNLESVKGPEDMRLKKTIRYTTNMEGIADSGADEERLDVFAEFSDTVPLELE